MSLQTTLARAEARACEQRWHDHRHNCPVCTRAVRSRHWAEMCREGGRLRRDSKEAAAALERERKLDKQPAPGQAQLF